MSYLLILGLVWLIFYVLLFALVGKLVVPIVFELDPRRAVSWIALGFGLLALAGSYGLLQWLPALPGDGSATGSEPGEGQDFWKVFLSYTMSILLSIIANLLTPRLNTKR